MKPADPQQVQPSIPQSVPTATGIFVSARTVAIALLVDRALTA